MADKVFIFDTDVADGEQVPGRNSRRTRSRDGAAAGGAERGNHRGGVPASSPGDFESVQASRRPSGAGHHRPRAAVKKDIDTLWDAVKVAKRPGSTRSSAPRISISRRSFRADREKILQWCVDTVKYARSLCRDVEFSTRTPRDGLSSTSADGRRPIVKAGPRRRSTIPDTVGYATPMEMADRVRRLKEKVPGLDHAILSMHCHDDLGMSTANTLAGILAGARQAEVTVNGIGERAGNASLEEVVLALKDPQGHLRRLDHRREHEGDRENEAGWCPS